jgi:periplasmic glucans biosynthesis protein
MPPTSWNRRDTIGLILGGLSGPLGAGLTGAAAQPRPRSEPVARPADGVSFTSSTVANLAQEVASKPYKPPAKISLGSLSTISPDDYAQIAYRPEKIVWGGDKLGFAIEPLHPGSNVTGQMQIFLVESGVARRLNYDPANFNFGKVKPPAANANLDHSGFRILKVDRNGTMAPIASFQDASYFTAIVPNQTWGLIARPLSVRATTGPGEEAPQIRMVWIEQPSVASNTLVIHALIDTSSLAAAYQFTLRANDVVIVDTECTIFARTAVGHFGLAATQATYFFGALERRNTDDVRPAAHEIKGAQILTGAGEWIWRPVTNRNSVQLSGFVDTNPRGFGLLQRDRTFEDFLDDDNQWQRRPSLWIEPIGEWGPGEVTLVEVPAASQNNKNIALYWRPKSGLASGSKSQFAYRQFWCWTPPEQPTGALVALSRIGRLPGNPPGARRRILVQFKGGPIGDEKEFADLAPKVWTSAGKLLSVRTFRSSRQKSLRVVFDFDPGGEPLVELRLVLESKGKPVSETWLYRWTQ